MTIIKGAVMRRDVLKSRDSYYAAIEAGHRVSARIRYNDGSFVDVKPYGKQWRDVDMWPVRYVILYVE